MLHKDSDTVPSTTKSAPASAVHLMSCMEVWGGNEILDNAIAMPGLVVYVNSRPYHGEAAGGDLFYVSSCGMGRITRILVADVAGHGTHVADLALKLRDLMRRFINYVDQTAFVSALNLEFTTTANIGKFATAIIATYWAQTDCLTVTNAGHPRPFWYCVEKGAWRILNKETHAHQTKNPSNLPLGLVDCVDYEQCMVRLAPGDVLLFYTDSITEASNTEGDMLGEEGFMALLETLDASKPDQLVQQILDQVELFRDGHEADDDQTIIAMVCSGQKPRRSLLEKFLAVALIGRVIVSRLLGKPAPIPWPEMSVVSMLGMFIRPVNRLWGGYLRRGEIREGIIARDDKRKRSGSNSTQTNK